MRQELTTLGELAGGAIFAYGAWTVAHPLGYLAGGALLAFFCWLADR